MTSILPGLSKRERGNALIRAAGVALICVLMSMAATKIALQLQGQNPSVYDYILAGSLPALLATPICAWLFLRIAQIRAAYRNLDVIASTDALTQCLNRRAFTDVIGRWTAGPGALLVVDADHFKLINDRFGHDQGDEALRLLAGAIGASIRDGDTLGRIGGEEFGVFLHIADADTARGIGERIRLAAAALHFCPDGSRWPLTVSIGGVANDEPVDFSELFRAADRRLYAAKRSGRDAVNVANYGSPDQPDSKAAA